ncbi:MAG: ADP-ribosylglycohydrolase family protein, partial [Chryseolinea sp.]
QGLAAAESLDFKYTTMSLNDVYEIGYKHALQNIQRNGGRVEGDNVFIKVQQPQAVKLEQSFSGHFPILKIHVGRNLKDEYKFEFDGIGFAISGESAQWNSSSDVITKAELYIDGNLIETSEFPASFTTRKYDLFWKYKLPKQKHVVRIKLLNPSEKQSIRLDEVIIYSDKPGDPSRHGQTN